MEWLLHCCSQHGITFILSISENALFLRKKLLHHPVGIWKTYRKLICSWKSAISFTWFHYELQPKHHFRQILGQELWDHEKQLISLPYHFPFGHDSVLIMFLFQVYLRACQDIKECDEMAWTGKPSLWSYSSPQVSFLHVTHPVAWYRITWSFTTD